MESKREFLKTPAKVFENKVHINTNIRVLNNCSCEPKPWWLVASAAFIFKICGRPHIALVKRMGNTAFAGQWALIPAGASDTLCELLHPSKALEREAQEELVLYKKGARVCPLQESRLLCPHNKIRIYDEANCEKYLDIGYLYAPENDDNCYFMRAYLVDLPFEELMFSDGEKGKSGNFLNRPIALVPLDDLDKDKMRPVAVYKNLKKDMHAEPIEITGLQTPTLRWLQEHRETLECTLKNFLG